ncbi:MAG: protease HtpX [Saprospirales bacterium]|nr:MAG: protease HtpX [Saprospirales bacterium]
MFRIGLFLLTNIAVILVATVVMSLLGVGSMLDETGTNLDLYNLLIFCFVFGMAGSFISLLISKKMAKWSTKARIIDKPANATEKWLVDEVRVMAREAGIGMPEVAIFPMRQANAFATGWNRNKALVAVSQGMLERFSKDEVKAVMGHEIGHVANGDMVTLTLIQGVVNTFVLFFSRIIGFFVDRVVFKTERGMGPGFWITTIVAQIVLGILASAIVMWFSRRREFSADIAGAKLGSRNGMIAALKRLKVESGVPNEMPESLNAFGITRGKMRGLKGLFMSHPPLDDRIAALEGARIG